MKQFAIYLIIAITALSFPSCNSQKLAPLKKGDSIPHFELLNEQNKLVKIQELIGHQNIVIYFYPKDDTPGCTKEACKFRDEFEDFKHLNAIVIGISSDSPKSHLAFKEKYNLPFTLLSDEKNTVRDLFGVQASYMGLVPGRVTYVVDKDGIIQHVFNAMSNAEKHVEEAKRVLNKLK
ncbi:MAG: peroxiredoxin [Salibacteraceae bacterium]